MVDLEEKVFDAALSIRKGNNEKREEGDYYHFFDTPTLIY